MEDFKEVNKALKVTLGWCRFKICLKKGGEIIFSLNYFYQGHAWLKDDEATQCKQCQKEFSIARRKVGSLYLIILFVLLHPVISMSSMFLVLQHHCRNCGDIYCSSCSSNELALPSYPRPVRVCDVCHSLLMQRSSSTGSWQNSCKLTSHRNFITVHVHPSLGNVIWCLISSYLKFRNNQMY